MTIQNLIAKLNGVRRQPHGYVAKCPAHQDDRQSLSITETGDRILVNCFAGCTTEQILKTLGMEWQQLFHDEKRTQSTSFSQNGVGWVLNANAKIKSIYRYTDENGKLLYENVRFEPKDFRQRHFDAHGRPVWNLQGINRVPYRLQQLVNNVRFGSDVFFCEGEKDADSLAELGFVTTSFKNWKAEFNRYITHVNAVIVRDHDLPGGVQAEEAARVIGQAADTVKILDPWPDVELPEKHGRDISDYIAYCVKEEGMSREEIAERLTIMADGLPLWTDTGKIKEKNLFGWMSGNETLEVAGNAPDKEMLFGEFWYESELCILFADTNVGKSVLAVQIGDAISRGESTGICKLETAPKRVVYFDFELTDKQFEARFKHVDPATGAVRKHVFHENFTRAFINIDSMDYEGFPSFEDFLNHSLNVTIRDTRAEVVILDNLTYLRDETENARSALPLMKYLKELKEKHGVSILALAHTPKRDSSKPLGRNDLQGSKMLVNFCDSSFAIGESHKDHGVRYLKQIKARNTGIVYHSENILLCTIQKNDCFLQFEALGTGSERVHLKSASDKDREKTITKVKELSGEGLSQREIAKQVGVSQMTVARYLKTETVNQE